MRTVTATLGIVLCAFGLFACAEGASRMTTPPASGPGIGERFTLRVEESATIAGSGLNVTYTKLVDDSRCPPDVTCVWEGDAVVAVSLAAPGSAEPKVAELHTYDQRPGSADLGQHRIELVQVSRDGRAATFVVTR